MTTEELEQQNPYENGDIKVEQQPRNINELLKLTSYADATDDEIKLLMAYKEQVAYKLGATAKQNDFNVQLKQTIEEHNKQMLAMASNNFATACRMKAEYARFEPVVTQATTAEFVKEV